MIVAIGDGTSSSIDATRRAATIIAAVVARLRNSHGVTATLSTEVVVAVSAGSNRLTVAT